MKLNSQQWLVAEQAEQFSYCQPWMLAWGYRKQNLLKELLNYNADIMCLQVCLPSKQQDPL